MCFICENSNRKESPQYDYSIISYELSKRTIHQYAIRYYQKSDEYILYVRSDDDAEMQTLPIKYCPFCGNKLH